MFKLIYFFKKLRYKIIKSNEDAFNRKYATVFYLDMSKKHFSETWEVLRDGIKKNLYDKGLCKVI